MQREKRVESLLSQTNGDVMVVYFADANLVNAARIDDVGEALMETMRRVAHGKMLLNFQVVRSMASKMLGKLIKLKKESAAAKVDLKLCNLCDNILEVFKVTALHKVFDIYPDADEALGHS